jgi:L-fuculose-phosphate aldolase
MDKLARDITVKNPAAIIENDCVIATGATLLKAFDRLEMMEYSAKALVLAATYGEDIIGIDPMEFRELEAAFKL